MKTSEHDFALGVLVALAHVRAAGQETLAQDIVGAIGEEPLIAAARYSQSKQDIDTLRWLRVKPKDLYRNDSVSPFDRRGSRAWGRP